MQVQGGVALMWSVALYWVCRLCSFLGGAGQGQPPPVFHPEPPCMSYKAICRWLLLVLGLEIQVKQNCDPKLAAASAGPGAA